MNQNPQRHFEDFIPTGTDDILTKTEALSQYLASDPQRYVDTLQPQLLQAPGSETLIKYPASCAKNVIMLGSNAFLSLANDPAVTAAAKQAISKYGCGTGAVPLYAGYTDLHRKLEQILSDFLGRESCLLFPTAYSANVGIISALCGPGDVIVNDSANHASIFDGARLSGADLKLFLHGNMKHLEKVLRSISSEKKGRLIITDGVFSMGGDVAKLDRICDLAEKYQARVMVDDAHGIGVVGPTGRGTPELFICHDRVDVYLGAFSKAFGMIGGFCAGSKNLTDYLRLYARTYFFSTSLPTPLTAALTACFNWLRTDPDLLADLRSNIAFMLEGLKTLGFDTGQTASAIIPVIIGDEALLTAIHHDLLKCGVYCNLVTYPAVRRKECRLRINILRTHRKRDLQSALAAFAKVGRKHGVIP
jgi:8-amino-7-oxononanoate synthase